MVQALINALIRNVWRILHRKVDPSSAIAIFGSPRSGTTWIMEILIRVLPKYWPVFEPLHRLSPEVQRLFRESFKDLSPPPWIPYKFYLEDDVVLTQFMDCVFRGGIHEVLNPYILIRMKRLLTSDGVLVKFVRANRLIPWILYRFRIRGAITNNQTSLRNNSISDKDRN